jgi:hypothetical protein
LSVPSSGTAGVAIPGSSVSAVLSGGSTPGGTVIFSVFGPSASAPTSCDSGWQVVGTAPVSGDGTYHPPAGFTPTGAGNYWWYATYGGDAGNGGAQSVCGAGATETAVGTAGTGTTGTVKLVRVTVSGTRVHLVLSCSGGPCAGTLNIAAIEHLKARTPTAIVATGRKPHGKPRTKSIVLASGRYAIAENASQAAALTLSRQATRLLKKLHRISGKLTVLPAGAATPTVTRTIRFKSPKQR